MSIEQIKRNYARRNDIPLNDMGYAEGCLDIYEDKTFGRSKCGMVDLCPKCQKYMDEIK